MRAPKVRELLEAVRALVRGPYTTRFPAVASPAAERFRGRPRRDEKECVLCGGCAQVCPAEALEVTDHTDRDPPVRRLVLSLDRCIYCGQCQAQCATGEGVKLSRDYDLAVIDRSTLADVLEKELVLCENCGLPITTRAHFEWIAERVGPLSYTNPALVVTMQRRLGLVPEAIGQPASYASVEHHRMLCPECRREVVLGELW